MFRIRFNPNLVTRLRKTNPSHQTIKDRDCFVVDCFSFKNQLLIEPRFRLRQMHRFSNEDEVIAVNESAHLALTTTHDCWRPRANLEVHLDEHALPLFSTNCAPPSAFRRAISRAPRPSLRPLLAPLVVRLPSRSSRLPDSELLMRPKTHSLQVSALERKKHHAPKCSH